VQQKLSFMPSLFSRSETPL